MSEQDIRRLDIHFVTKFTWLHLVSRAFVRMLNESDRAALQEKCRVYEEEYNNTAAAFYRPRPTLITHPGAAILLSPRQSLTMRHLNRTFLHETRHHIQDCLGLPCAQRSPETESLEWEYLPWEIDAIQFADQYCQQVSFFLLPEFCLPFPEFEGSPLLSLYLILPTDIREELKGKRSSSPARLDALKETLDIHAARIVEKYNKSLQK